MPASDPGWLWCTGPSQSAGHGRTASGTSASVPPGWRRRLQRVLLGWKRRGWSTPPHLDTGRLLRMTDNVNHDRQHAVCLLLVVLRKTGDHNDGDDINDDQHAVCLLPAGGAEGDW